jgi:hypothetical protein
MKQDYITDDERNFIINCKLKLRAVIKAEGWTVEALSLDNGIPSSTIYSWLDVDQLTFPLPGICVLCRSMKYRFIPYWLIPCGIRSIRTAICSCARGWRNRLKTFGRSRISITSAKRFSPELNKFSHAKISGTTATSIRGASIQFHMWNTIIGQTRTV